MKKLIATAICGLIFTSSAIAGSSNYGGIKVGSCKEKTYEFANLGTHIDEFEVGANALLVSVSGTDSDLFTDVALCPSSKGKFSSYLLLKNSGVTIASLSLSGVGT
jgi:hypothetical protein